MGYAGGVGIGAYAYVRARPSRFVDPFGLKSVSGAAARCFRAAVEKKVYDPLSKTDWAKKRPGVMEAIKDYHDGDDFTFVFGSDAYLPDENAGLFEPTELAHFFYRWWSAEIYLRVDCAYKCDDPTQGCADESSIPGRLLGLAESTAATGSTLVCECCWIELRFFVGNVVHESSHASRYSPYDVGRDRPDSVRGDEYIAHSHEQGAAMALGYEDPYPGDSVWAHVVETY